MKGKLVLFGDQLYRLPQEDLSLRGIRVLRAGLHIGEFKKGRLEPAHALAMAFGERDVQCAVTFSVSDTQVVSYYRGEPLYVEPEQVIGNAKGWCLLVVDGCSAGWGKLANHQVKNHYPKGLRREL